VDNPPLAEPCSDSGRIRADGIFGNDTRSSSATAGARVCLAAGHFGFVLRRPRRAGFFAVGLADVLVGSTVGSGIGLGLGVGLGGGSPPVGDGRGGDGGCVRDGPGGKNLARSFCIRAAACCSIVSLALTSSSVDLVFASIAVRRCFRAGSASAAF
jgi:hypothetical protein